MKVNSINIRNTAQIKITPIYNPELAHVQMYEDFAIHSVVSNVDGHRIFMLQFEHINATVTIEEVWHRGASDDKTSITVRYTNHSNLTLTIVNILEFIHDWENGITFPIHQVITAINNRLQADYNFVVFPDIDYKSLCNF